MVTEVVQPEVQPVEPVSGESSAETENADNTHMIPKERFDEVNSRMKEYEKQFKAAEKALQEAQEARLKEKEDYKELYEQKMSELSELKPLADQVESYKETMERLLEAQIEEIPEELQTLIPDEMTVKQKIDWIAKNKKLLLKPVGPDIGAGQRGSGASGKGVVLDAEQKEVARMFGYTDEEYIQYLDKEEA